MRDVSETPAGGGCRKQGGFMTQRRPLALTTPLRGLKDGTPTRYRDVFAGLVAQRSGIGLAPPSISKSRQARRLCVTDEFPALIALDVANQSVDCVLKRQGFNSVFIWIVLENPAFGGGSAPARRRRIVTATSTKFALA